MASIALKRPERNRCKSSMHWVDRRRAALMVVWVRGGDKGFEGLGKRLSEALQEIDYEPHCRSGR
jgi:hypothetical protein